MAKQSVGLKDATNESAAEPPRKTDTVTDSQSQRMNFPDAIRRLIVQGQKVTRLEWNNADIYLDIRNEYLVIHHANGKISQLLLREGDMFADDWVVVS